MSTMTERPTVEEKIVDLIICLPAMPLETARDQEYYDLGGLDATDGPSLPMRKL